MRSVLLTEASGSPLYCVCQKRRPSARRDTARIDYTPALRGCPRPGRTSAASQGHPPRATAYASEATGGHSRGFDGICEGWNTGQLCRPTESFGSPPRVSPCVAPKSDRWPDMSLATMHGSSNGTAWRLDRADDRTSSKREPGGQPRLTLALRRSGSTTLLTAAARPGRDARSGVLDRTQTRFRLTPPP